VSISLHPPQTNMSVTSSVFTVPRLTSFNRSRKVLPVLPVFTKPVPPTQLVKQLTPSVNPEKLLKGVVHPPLYS